jgi:hypothetical protein
MKRMQVRRTCCLRLTGGAAHESARLDCLVESPRPTRTPYTPPLWLYLMKMGSNRHKTVRGTRLPELINSKMELILRSIRKLNLMASNRLVILIKNQLLSNSYTLTETTTAKSKHSTIGGRPLTQIYLI